MAQFPGKARQNAKVWIANQLMQSVGGLYIVVTFAWRCDDVTPKGRTTRGGLRRGAGRRGFKYYDIA